MSDNVQMILYAIYNVYPTVFSFYGARDILENLAAIWFCHDRFAVFSTEDNLIKNLCICTHQMQVSLLVCLNCENVSAIWHIPILRRCPLDFLTFGGREYLDQCLKDSGKRDERIPKGFSISNFGCNPKFVVVYAGTTTKWLNLCLWVAW